jgi:ATP-dependent Lon protease, bacterial type
MVTAIVSVMTGIPVRRDVAMTGEITLRGRVLPIGGLKEKLLAASRGGMKTVLIPEENAKDLVEISESIKKGLEILPVSRMDEVLARALTRKPEPIEWDEEKAKPTETSSPPSRRSRPILRCSPRTDRSRRSKTFYGDAARRRRFPWTRLLEITFLLCS